MVPAKMLQLSTNIEPPRKVFVFAKNSQADLLAKLSGVIECPPKEKTGLPNLNVEILVDSRLIKILVEHSSMDSPICSVRHERKSEVPRHPEVAVRIGPDQSMFMNLQLIHTTWNTIRVEVRTLLHQV